MKTTTVLSVLANEQGGHAEVAARTGIHINTLYRASAGIGVSSATSEKSEAFFGMPINEWQAPLVDAIRRVGN